MQRTSYKHRDRIYTQAPYFGQIVPIFRKFVLPGQRIDAAELRLNFQTAPLASVYMNSGVVRIMSFYVPLRLVWDEFPDVIADNVPFAVPKSTVAAPWLFDVPKTSNSWHTLYRRAVKLCYNQFFGDSEWVRNVVAGTPQNVWYDMADDDDVTQRVTKNLEGRLLQVQPAEDLGIDATFPVTSPINLRDFARAMGRARRDFKQEAAGDKYVDFLRHMGVEPDWRVQMAPELLGQSSMDIFPQYQTATDGDNLGKSVTKYYGTVRHDFGGKAFAEHGYIVTLAVARLVVPFRNFGPSDLAFDGAADRSALWVGNDPPSIDYSPLNWNFPASGNNTDAFTAPPAWLSTGSEYLTGNIGSADYMGIANNTNFYDLFYPEIVVIKASGNELGTDLYAMHADWSVKGLTPAARSIAF